MSKNLTKTMAVRLSEAEYQRIEKEATAQGLSMSSALRKLITGRSIAPETTFTIEPAGVAWNATAAEQKVWDQYVDKVHA